VHLLDFIFACYFCEGIPSRELYLLYNDFAKKRKQMHTKEPTRQQENKITNKVFYSLGTNIYGMRNNYSGCSFYVNEVVKATTRQYFPCTRPECQNIDAPDNPTNYKHCSVCKTVYCSPHCAQLDWNDRHNIFCKKYGYPIQRDIELDKLEHKGLVPEMNIFKSKDDTEKMNDDIIKENVSEQRWDQLMKLKRIARKYVNIEAVDSYWHHYD
jgi:DNA repair exonuclease SbcCD nuclease subunit